MGRRQRLREERTRTDATPLPPGVGPPPVEADFLDPRSRDSDERCALRNFLGQSADQAEAMFREAMMYYGEDLMWMGPAALRYYLPAAIRVVLSPAADGDDDMLVQLFIALRSQRQVIAADPALAELVRSAIGELLADFDRFRYDEADGMFGDLAAEFRQLLGPVGE